MAEQAVAIVLGWPVLTALLLDEPAGEVGIALKAERLVVGRFPCDSNEDIEIAVDLREFSRKLIRTAAVYLSVA